MKQRPSISWLIVGYVAVYVVWGTTYLASRYALVSFPPFVISALRYLAAGGLLAAFAFLKKQQLPHMQDVLHLSISGILMLVGGSGLVVVAEQYISSGSAAVLVATEPFWFVLLDRSRWPAYFSQRGVLVGLFVGFAGILLYARFTPGSPGLPANQQLQGVIITLAGCVLWVVGTLYSARLVKQQTFNLWHGVVQLFAAGLFAALLALCFGEWQQTPWTKIQLSAWAGLGYLVVFGSLIAYLAFAWLVTVQPPAIVSTHTYVNPVIAVIAGWLLLQEQVSLWQVVALAVVLLGVLLTQLYKPATSN